MSCGHSKLLLEVKELTKRFGGLVALKDFDLQVAEGEILGLIGPNGAGKTTFFNIVAGVYSPDAGEIWFNGLNIVGSKPWKICRLGIARTFQIVRPFREMTVFENVMVGASFGADRSDVMNNALTAIKIVGLSGKEDVPAGRLTLADQRRLEIARALATKPKLLLLDEVMAGLNPTETQQAMLLIDKIRKIGVTIVMIEHVMQAVMNISDRIVVLDHGEKIAEGKPQDISRDQRVIKAYLGEEYA
ncbi:MAG: ABC transporter ATP-binding protein [Nitrososphaeria archaeon]